MASIGKMCGCLSFSTRKFIFQYVFLHTIVYYQHSSSAVLGFLKNVISALCINYTLYWPSRGVIGAHSDDENDEYEDESKTLLYRL